MKSIHLLALGFSLFSFAALAQDFQEFAAAAPEVLGACVDASTQKPAFQIIGNSGALNVYRTGAVATTVLLRDKNGQDVFPATVSLTKTTPYQFVIAADARKESEKATQIGPVLYGWSVGNQMGIHVVISSQQFKLFSCTLSSTLFAKP